MDQRDFRVPVATTLSQNNSSGGTGKEEGRPRSSLATVHATETGYSLRVDNTDDIGLTDGNCDSLSEEIKDDSDVDTSKENLDVKGNASAIYGPDFPNGSNVAYDDSKPNASSVNDLNFKGFITELTKVRTPILRKTFIENSDTDVIDANTKSTTDLPTLDLTHCLPPLTKTITQGFGVKMVASSSCQQLIYRSVPPRPLSYAFTDVLDSRSSKLRSKTAPVSVNSPEEYIQRFKSRPTTRPKVVEFDGTAVSSKTKRSAIGAAFPTARAKVYIGHHKTSPAPSSDAVSAKSSSSRLHLAPLTQPGQQQPSTGFMSSTSRSLRTAAKSPGAGTGTGSLHGNQAATTSRTFTRSANSSSPGQPPKSSLSVKQPVSETTRSAEFMTMVNRVSSPDVDDHIHNPELLLTSSNDCDDLSILPPPKKVLPRREVPWVFRYKVKKGMNTLSRIMASRPSQNVLHSSYSFT